LVNAYIGQTTDSVFDRTRTFGYLKKIECPGVALSEYTLALVYVVLCTFRACHMMMTLCVSVLI